MSKTEHSHKMKRMKHLHLIALVLAGALINVQSFAAPPVLVHRYGFTNDASDSVGHADGTLLYDPGSISSGPPTCNGISAGLDGISQYISLPPNLMTNLHAITFEEWLTPQLQISSWARLWDFGDRYTNTDGSTGSTREFYGTDSYAGGGVGAQMNGNAGNLILSDGPIGVGTESHVVWTSDGSTSKARIYINGLLVASSDTFPNAPDGLGLLPYEFIGRSLFSPDPYLQADIDEFRIWNGALNQLQVAASDQSGPDVLNTNFGTITTLALQPIPNMVPGLKQQTSTLANASGLTGGPYDIHDQLGVVYSSDNTGVATVSADGLVTAVALGSAHIVATLGSLTSTQLVNVVPAPVVLAHRYSFTSDASDSVGGATGVFSGNAKVAGGQLVLDGSTGTYLQLPVGIVTNDPAVTIEAWATFGTLPTWANLFDFGLQDASGLAAYDIHLGIHDSGPNTICSIADSDNANAHNQAAFFAGPLDNQTNVHVVVVFNPPQGYEAIYINGALRAANTAVTIPMSAVRDVRNIVGADDWPDPAMVGSIDEFRIYNGALTAPQIAVANAAGVTSTSTDPGALQSIAIQMPATIVLESALVAPVLANYANLANFNLTGNSPVSPVVLTSSDSNIVAQAADGMVHAYNIGKATITASYQGKTSSQLVTVIRPARAALAHRYSFTSDATDSVGSANGQLMGAATISNGKVVLNGTGGTYVNLPGGLITGYQATTIEFWADMGNTGGWTYGWAFGNTVGTPGVGQNLLHFIVETGFGTHQVAVGTSAGAVNFNMPGILANESVHMTVVDDPANGVLAVYTNGILDGISYNNTVPLSSVATNFSYIGHSLWDLDGYVTANFDEFRIYNGRLFSDEIAADDALGPNQLIGSSTSVTLTPSVSGGNLTLTWPISSALVRVVSTPTLGGSWTDVNGTLTINGSNYQMSVPLTGAARFFGLQR